MAAGKVKSKTKGKAKRKAKADRPRPFHRLRGALWAPLGWVLKWLMRLVAGIVVFAVLWVHSYRVIDPPIWFYLLSERWRLGAVSQEWRPLDQMTPDLALAAMAAEDARFCAHHGFDFAAIEAALAANAEGRRLRGGSTISQQVAKNVFLWPERSWLRKGMEAGFTLLIELIWPKRRIVEVYLNIAEFDRGVFGAAAAARHYFGRDVADLSLVQAARLAAVLPDPKGRDAARPGPWTQRRARAIADGARTLAAEDRADCVLDPGKT